MARLQTALVVMVVLLTAIVADARVTRLEITRVEPAFEGVSFGDAGLSIEERYRNHGAYVSAVARAANRLHQERLLLDEDVERYVEASAAGPIGRP